MKNATLLLVRSSVVSIGQRFGVLVDVLPGADSMLVSWQPPTMPNSIITQYAVVAQNTG